MREALEAHGVDCELLVITDGERAIRYLAELDSGAVLSPDLVILDLNLPKRSGHEVLHSMRQSSKLQDTTIIVLTSSDAHCDRTASLSAGASQFIRKPLRLKEFRSLGSIFKETIDAAAGGRN